LTPKKILLPGLLAFVFFVFACSPGAAGEKVGVLDQRKVLFQHPKFDAVAKHIVEMTRHKENEIRFTLENETDPERKAGILKAANTEMAETEERLMSSIHKDCENALAAVMEKRNITIVLKMDSVYLGGADITEDVIAQLRAIAKNQ
jgi:Skp family chaperone for outer membrane proteins